VSKDEAGVGRQTWRHNDAEKGLRRVRDRGGGKALSRIRQIRESVDAKVLKGLFA
jgi:hypothetical protein